MEKFSYEANGYNRQEVNQFVNDVIAQTEGIIKKCRAQGEALDKLKVELEHYKRMETTLQTAILKAEETGDNIKRMAREEHEMIVRDAKIMLVVLLMKLCLKLKELKIMLIH